MNLQGSITELQDTIATLYLNLEQRFKENQLIRDLWTAMAHDVTQQKQSMAALPHSFWLQLKGEQDVFARVISGIRQQPTDKKEDLSLISCFERTLVLEEPATLSIYVPIIRKLRENWTDRALDFYIMVKAHLARINRVTQSFAGDPVIIQRAGLLLQRFEKEVQEPHVIAEPPIRKARPPKPLQLKEKQEAKPPKPQKKVLSKQPPVLAKHVKSHHGRAKPLAKKISLPRRRARR